MGIKQMPSASRLRQRFDEDATQLIPLIEDSLPEVLLNFKAPVTPLPEKLDKLQHIPLDMDVFSMDNSKTKKEKVEWTYKQFHSEFKTDLDLERLPSGKFDTNDLVMCLAALIYNILRYMGQSCLLGPDAPIRHSAKRRRLKTVIQELIFMAARLLKKGRQYKLRFGRHCPGFKSFHQLLSSHALC